jgi:hypothetical protein
LKPFIVDVRHEERERVRSKSTGDKAMRPSKHCRTPHVNNGPGTTTTLATYYSSASFDYEISTLKAML